MHCHGGYIKILQVGLSQKWCGILAFRLCQFTEIGGSTEWLQKVQGFP